MCFLQAIGVARAAEQRGCVASIPLGSVRILVRPAAGGEPRPVRQVNIIDAGHRLLYRPVHLPAEIDKDDARVALVLAPAAGDGELTVLEPRPAAAPAEWSAPFRVGVVALVFGPQGLSAKKVRSLVEKDRDLISQLADYAEQTAQVEALVDTLAAAESSNASLDAAIAGFASRYGLPMTKFDRNAPAGEQAALLLRSLNPALASYDPLAPQSTMQQSAGLAASVAGLFFGSTVGLAAGSAAMAQNLRTMLFPDTDFRSALAQPAGEDGVTLCAKRQPSRSRTRLAYLWAHRIPNAAPPALALAGPAHVPLGVKSTVAVKLSGGPEWKFLDRAHGWRLTGAGSFDVQVKPLAPGQLEVDLGAVPAKPGVYRLAARWDWSEFEVPGELHVHALGGLASITIGPESQDRLVEGSGTAAITLAGADFQFVESVACAGVELSFRLPLGPRAGPQESLEAFIDTGRFKAGDYRLVLTQSDGVPHEVPIRIHPPHPRIENLPLRANLGEKAQRFALRGSGLERIERIESPQAEIELLPGAAISVRLKDGAAKGSRLPILLHVAGLHAPVTAPDAILVAGPRPRIAALKRSLPEDLGVALRDGELPAKSFASFSMQAEHIEGQAALKLACLEREKTLAPRELRPTGDVLFFSFDPGEIGQPGCTIAATMETQSAGASDPYPLGRVVRLPRIANFVLTNERLGETAFAGVLTGEDLETIERTGWDPHHGLPVEELPRPVAGQGRQQTLRFPVPWPSPAPHAPLYIWLRGECEGRATKARY